MKKNSLLKAILVSFLIFIAISWIIPAGTYSEGAYIKYGINPVGIFDIIRMPLISIQTFIQYGILILSIGAFYGVLNKTLIYSDIINNIVSKFSKKPKMFLILTILILSLLSSITGLTLPLFILVPLLFTVIVLLGYNKMTALASTVGSILVGNICSICGSNITGLNNLIFNLSVFEEIFVKIILFIIIVFLFTQLVISNKEIKTKEKIELLFYEDSKKKNNKSTLPGIIIGIMTIIISIFAMYDIESVFNISIFSNIYESLINFEIGGFYLFEKLLSGLLVFGTWSNYELSALILIASFIIGWVYDLKLNDIIEGIKDGIKKFYKVALYAILANIVFTFVLNMVYIIPDFLTNILLGNALEFSVIRVSLASIINCLFYNDYSWLMNNGITNVLLAYDASTYSIIAILLNAIFGLAMTILPTSILLAVGLTFANIEYKDWVRYIYKFILIVLALVIILSLLLTLFI